MDVAGGSAPSTATPIAELLLRRIGLATAPPADAGGLRVVHRAFVSSIPYDNLTIQLGESEPLDGDALCRRMLAGGRGGYCFEVNTVLVMLLEDLGFEVQRRQGIVGPRESFANGEPTNHLALVATTPAGERFIVEAGRGDGPLDPMPLEEGSSTTVGSFTWRVEREGEGWWVIQDEFGSAPGFQFVDEPAQLADFEEHHQRLSTSPESGFVRTLVVQQPREDRIVTLRARTLTMQGPDVDERTVLADSGELAAALSREFGIEPDALGDRRLQLLWEKVVGQHETYLAEQASKAEG